MTAPTIMRKGLRGLEPDLYVNRFMAKNIPEPNSGCWLWLGANSGKDGYGVFFLRGKNQKAHRASFLLFNGQIPEDMHVLHKCDVPCCVNPSHLFLGTHLDNMKDKKSKGRVARICGLKNGRYTKPHMNAVGERNGQSKLTEEDVHRIRKSSKNNCQLGREYGVSNVLISQIRLRKSWRHI